MSFLQLHLEAPVESASGRRLCGQCETSRVSFDEIKGEPEDNPLTLVPAKTTYAQNTPPPPLGPPPLVNPEAEPPSNMIGYKQCGNLFECLACEQTFTEEFSCWQHIVSRPECHEEPHVLDAVREYVNSSGPSKKKKKKKS